MAKSPHQITEKEIPSHWFRSRLYRDKEFIAYAERLKEFLEGKRGSQILMSESRDPELTQYTLKPHELTAVDNLARRFMISRDDIYLYWIYKKSGFLTARFPVFYNDGDQTVIRIYHEHRLKDIEAVWPYIEKLQAEFKGYKERTRSPDNPNLIYAIYIGKRKGMKWAEIFDLYKSGKLFGYKGSKDQFITKEVLKAYYNKYRPIRNT